MLPVLSYSPRLSIQPRLKSFQILLHCTVNYSVHDSHVANPIVTHRLSVRTTIEKFHCQSMTKYPVQNSESTSEHTIHDSVHDSIVVSFLFNEKLGGTFISHNLSAWQIQLKGLKRGCM